MALALSTVPADSVNAQQQDRESITISPTIKRYEVEPGELIQDKLTVLNDGNVPYDFSLYAEPYSVIGRDYQQSYDAGRPRADAYKWIEFGSSNMSAAVRQTIEMPFSIRIPEDATPGGHYGIIFAETQPDNNRDQGAGVLRKKRIGLTVLITVKGDVRLDGGPAAISIDRRQSVRPLLAKVEVRNTGNTDFLAKTEMRVSNILGNTVHRSSRDNYIFPDTTRELDMKWQDPNWLGVYQVYIRSSANGKMLEKSQYVVMAPLWFIVMAIVLFGIGIIYGVRGLIERKRRGQQDS